MDDVDRNLNKRLFAIKYRCYVKTAKAYKNYGGRGIKLSEEFHDPVTFVKYCRELPGFSIDLEIDRIDVNKNYERGNIKFSTPREQLRNTRLTAYVTYRGAKINVPDFCDAFIKKYTRGRVRNLALSGLTGEEILSRESSSNRAGLKFKKRK